jgi:hypothetical protein
MISNQLSSWFFGFRRKITEHIFRTGKKGWKNLSKKAKYRCRVKAAWDFNLVG